MLNVFDGQITQTDGLRDALEGILSAKSVQNGVLRIRSDLVSGRVGIFCARFITGAQVDSTGESGGLALRRLLSARSGSFSFEDARGSDISDLKQSLSIDVEILLENITELLAGKSVTLSDGSMFGFAMPANRIKKPSGESAPTPSPPPAAPAQPAPSTSTPSGLSAQWKLLASAREAQPAAESNGEAPKEEPDSSYGAAETGDFQAIRLGESTPKPSLAEGIAPSENTFEYGTLGTDERQALEITGEFGTSSSDEHLHPEAGDLRAQMQTSAPVKPSIPQQKPAVTATPAAPPAAATAPAPAPAPIVVPQAQPPATPKLQPVASPETPRESIPLPTPDLSTPAPLATDFASAGAAAAANAATGQPSALAPTLHAQAFGAQVDLSLPMGGPQPGLIKPAKNELEDFVSEMQAFNNNRAETEAKPISGTAASGSNELDSFVNELRAHSNKSPSAAKNELDDFMAEMQASSAPNKPAEGPVGLIKPAKNELEDFAAELRASQQQPPQPAINPFNDEEIVPESGSFGIGDLFATKPTKKEPEPPPPAPVQKNSGTEYTMADLFSSKGGAGGPDAKPATPSGNDFAQAQPVAPAKPALGALPPAAVQNSVATPPAVAAEVSKFSDAFAEKSPGMGDEIVKPPGLADPFASSGSAASDAFAASSAADAFNSPSPLLGSESIRPSAMLGSPPPSVLSEPALGESTRASGNEHPSAFSSPESSKAANTLPPVRNTAAQSMPLTGAAAGLPSQRQDKATGSLSGLPSQGSKPTSDYQLPSQRPTGQAPKGSGQTMKSALNSLPSMNRNDMEVEQAQPDPDWPDDFPPPERMRRTTDVPKPSKEERPPEPMPAWDDPAFDPEELMKRRRERRGGLQEPDGDPFDRIAASRASEAAQSGGKLRAIVEEGAAQSAFAPMAHPNAMVKPSVQHGPKPGFRKLHQWNTSGMFAVKIVAVLLVLGAGAAFWHFYGVVVMTAVQKIFAPPPPPPPEKPPVVTKPKTDTTVTKKKTKRRRRRGH